ncbi:MAG: mdtK [Gammaproteobacteria bacterium]|jgi:Na+-driven multidrug efflux pump|nr:mdtK [Gammaproteobacteria bacterium]
MSIAYEDIIKIQTTGDNTALNDADDTSIDIIAETNALFPNEEPVNIYGSLNADPQAVENKGGAFTSFFTVFKKISRIGIPMGLSFTFSFEIFLTVLLLQRLSESEEDTAAATAASTMMSTVCSLLLAPLFSVAICLSNKIGEWQEEENRESENEEDIQEPIQILSPAITRERKKEKIESTNINAFLLASVLTAPTVLTLYYSRPILTTIFRQDEAVARSAAEFLRPYGFAVPGLAARFCIEQIMFSFGETQAAMWMALGSFSIGASLSVLLGFGINVGPLQIPRMEQKGVALGFVVESYLTALSYGLFVKFSKQYRQFDFYKVSVERVIRNLDGLIEILRLGGAITFTIAIELAMTLSVATFSGLLGTEEEAAMSYCMQFMYFELIMLAAFSITCTQEMSREVGAKKFSSAQNTGIYGLLTTLIYLTPLPVIFAVFPKALEIISGGVPQDAPSSGTTEDISSMLAILVPIISLGFILDSARYNLLQQSRALNDLIVPNIIALIGMSSGIGLAAALGFATPLGIYGVGIGYTIGVGVTAGALGLRWWNRINDLGNREQNAPLAQDVPAARSPWGCISSFFCCSRNTTTPIQTNFQLLPENNF